MTSVHGFELLRERRIPELNTHARLLRHVATGAELLSLENDDENKVFGISFRTPPADSTGVAHILEHAVLAGSRKYPLKDPFVELLKGSLQTFLNAFTYPDKTCYPVASTNLQDFYNLVDVYLDTVFYPLLREKTFQQEGWHYELERLDDPLTYKGVVFNEMKGAYSSPDSVLYRSTQQAIFPDNAYGVDSGGDPGAILDLTYEQFKDFHTRYYHPSNSRIYFYGNDDPTERLRILDGYLKDFAQLLVDSEIQIQPRFDTPRSITRPYAAGPDSAGSRKSMLNVAWMLDTGTDAETVLGLNILEHILIGTPAAPLRKALIDSGLGEDTTGAGLVDSLRQFAFSIGLKGITSESAGAVEKLVVEVFEQLAHKGLDDATIAASMNTVEFMLRENNTGSYPRGLSLMIRALNTWLYDGDPFEPIAFEAPLGAIKARIASGERYFENLIKRYFLGNTHRATVLLQPDPELGQRENEIERARLDQARATFTEADLQTIIEHTRLLKQFQETPDPPEALAKIPSLKLTDLEPKNTLIPIETLDLNGTRVLYHDLFTNGILYLDVGMDLHTLPQELLPYVPLFGRALLDLGTERENFVQLSQRIGRSTGGIRPQSLTSAVRGSSQSTAWLFLRGKSTIAQTNDLLAVLRDVLLTVQLDNPERMRQIVLEEKASREAGLVPGGHGVVNTRIRSQFNESDWASEQIGGISFLFFLRELAHRIDSDWPGVLAAFQKIHEILVNRATMTCNVTINAAGWAQVEPHLHTFLGDLPKMASTPADWAPTYSTRFEGLTIPAQVNYVGKGADLYKLGYTLHGSANVISKYLRTAYLWEKVRIQGGAYGGFSTFDPRSGVFSFLSYRDPNLLGTLNVYDQTAEVLRKLEISDAELSRTIIGAIGEIDAYQLPDAKGYTSMARFLAGDTDAYRQRIRDEVLTTRLADFHRFADVIDQVRSSGHVVVLGGQAAIEAANTERPGLLEIIKVL